MPFCCHAIFARRRCHCLHGKKQPVHVHLPGYELFAFAGLWTAPTDEVTGEITESCTIVTTSRNSLVAPVGFVAPVVALGAPTEVKIYAGDLTGSIYSFTP